MSSDRRHIQPHQIERAIEPASVARKIPDKGLEAQEPDLERYKKHLARAIAIDDRVLNQKRGQLVEIREAGPAHPEKQAATAALVRELQRDVELINKRVREETRLNMNVLASEEMDAAWYEEEQIKRGQRALVNNLLEGKKIPEPIRKKYGNYILTLSFAAYLNEDVMSEYTPEQKAEFRRGIDNIVVRLALLKKDGDKEIAAHLLRAVKHGYIALPPPLKQGATITPAPFLAGVESRLTRIWDLVVQDINKPKPSPRERVDPKSTTFYARVRPLEKPKKEYTQPKAFLEHVRTGNRVVVELMQLGRRITCEFTVEEIAPRANDVVLSSTEARLNSPQREMVGPYNIAISTTGLPRVSVIAAAGASPEQLAQSVSNATGTLFKILD